MGMRCDSYFMHCRRTYAINSLSINGVTDSYANNNNNYLNCCYCYYYYYYYFENK